MALTSMTGFGRADGSDAEVAWFWEIRTVNGRGRDLRFRLPPGYDDLEQDARAIALKQINRGNCSINLQLKRGSGSGAFILNEPLLTQALDAVRKAQELAGDDCPVAPARLDGLLSLRGILELSESLPDEASRKTRKNAILESLGVALTQMQVRRQDEGARLEDALRSQIQDIHRLTQTAKNSPSRTPENIQLRLSQQLERLVNAQVGLDEGRLYQEAVLLATKADIEEEVLRLEAHCAAALDLLEAQQPVGRQFEFLIQELNREANTLCSKSNDLAQTQTGLKMKTLIDQMREQIQNIE